jgi:hypothetical protein
VTSPRHTPRSGRRRRAVLIAGLTACSLTATACTLGQATSFSGRADAACRQVADEVGPVPANPDPTEQLQYALDRYTDVERAVAEISSDVAFPGGARGRALRRDWIDPAEQSLRDGWDDLRRLSRAVAAGDDERAAAEFTAARSAGTAGVRPATIRAAGLDACAQLFTPVP